MLNNSIILYHLFISYFTFYLSYRNNDTRFAVAGFPGFLGGVEGGVNGFGASIFFNSLFSDLLHYLFMMAVKFNNNYL